MTANPERLGLNQRTATLNVRATTALSSFVVCPLACSFVGAPSISPLMIYQMAYEQAVIETSAPRGNAPWSPDRN